MNKVHAPILAGLLFVSLVMFSLPAAMHDKLSQQNAGESPPQG